MTVATVLEPVIRRVDAQSPGGRRFGIRCWDAPARELLQPLFARSGCTPTYVMPYLRW